MFSQLFGQQPQPKPQERINAECPICLREREPYMMRTLRCNHSACKEHLNVWGDQSDRCPYCNQPGMVPIPYLYQTEFNPNNNVLGLTPEQWDDDWRWEEYDRNLDLYTRDGFERSNPDYFIDDADPFPEDVYLEEIADRVRDAEKRRNTQIYNYLYAKTFPQYANLQPDEELRYKRMIENRRELRSLGFEPKDARELSRQIEKGETTLAIIHARLQPMFRIPISGASGGGSKRGSKRGRKLKKRKRDKSNKRK